MISVCMATYNGGKYLREQIDSILEQLKSGDELIISDDGSQDDTLSIIKSFNDSRIVLILNQGEHGVNANFENALRHAKGDYIFLSDQDDIWVTGKIDRCLDALKYADCVVHDAVVVDSEKNVISSSFFKERRSGAGFWKNIYQNTCIGCCMAFKRTMLDVILPIPITTAFFHDNWIGCIADAKFHLCFIPFQGIMFRRHINASSCTSKHSKYNKFQQLGHRIIQLYHIIRRLYI